MSEQLFVCNKVEGCSHIAYCNVAIPRLSHLVSEYRCPWSTGKWVHDVPYPAPAEQLWVCDHNSECKVECPGHKPRTMKQLRYDCSVLCMDGSKQCGQNFFVKAIPYHPTPEVKTTIHFDGQHWQEEPMPVGICTIDSCAMRHDGHCYSPMGSTCKHLKEKPMPEYEIIRPISIKSLEEAGACERELHRFAFLALKEYHNSGWSLGYGTSALDADRVVRIAAQCQGGIAFLKEKGFIREKVEPLKAGDKVRVRDGSWSYWVRDGKLVPSRDSGYLIGHGHDSPMEIIAICDGLPTRLDNVDHEDYDEVAKNNLILKGQSGNIYFSHTAFVKRV